MGNTGRGIWQIWGCETRLRRRVSSRRRHMLARRKSRRNVHHGVIPHGVRSHRFVYHRVISHGVISHGEIYLHLVRNNLVSRHCTNRKCVAAIDATALIAPPPCLLRGGGEMTQSFEHTEHNRGVLRVKHTNVNVTNRLISLLSLSYLSRALESVASTSATAATES